MSFSLNGVKLSEWDYSTPISSWVSWYDERGTDIIIAADEKFRVFAFEVYNSKFLKNITECHSKIISIKCSEKYSFVAILEKSGLCSFLPAYFEPKKLNGLS